MSVDIKVNEDGETLLLKAARIVTSCERLPNTYTTVEPLDETRRGLSCPGELDLWSQKSLAAAGPSWEAFP